MITSKNNEDFFVNKNVVTVGTNNNCDFKLDLDFEVYLAIRYDFSLKNYVILNTFSNHRVLFCSKPLTKLELGSLNKIFFKNSNEYLTIRVLHRISA